MTKPIVREHNVINNEINDREMTTAEFNEYKKIKAEVEAEKIKIQAKEAARQVILDRLGLTADEVKLLLG